MNPDSRSRIRHCRRAWRIWRGQFPRAHEPAL